jgi:type I restriction enzyme M protein
MSRDSLANDVWRACDIMRRDDGTTGIMEYMEQLSWLLFLKAFEDIENHYEEVVRNYGNVYSRALDGPYRWSIWTGSLRKRAESQLAEARQAFSKATVALERSRKRTDALKSSKSPDTTNGKIIESNYIEKINEAGQDNWEAQLVADDAQTALKAAEMYFDETLAWLEDQVKILYDEQHVEQGVLDIVERQFGGQLDLSQEQFNLLRETERQAGRILAAKLVKGLDGQDLLDFVDNRLFPYLRHLKGTPERDTINVIFREIPGNRMRSPNNLREVITLLDKVHFEEQEDTQIVSQIYEGLLSRLGTEGGIAGEFYTPRPIINFMVRVIDPRIGETIFDPFSGSAGFLVEAYKHMAPQEQNAQDHERLQRSTFYGQEKKPLPTLLGMMNMILHGALTPNITRTNTLEKEDVRNIPSDQRYHIILTNPPFGGTEGAHIQDNFPIQSTVTELLALQYIMAKLDPKGRCGVVVPSGVLFRVDDAFVGVKKMLLENFNLYAIINLPAGVFANLASAGTGPKTNILFFEGPGPTKQIWYYEVRQVGFTLTKAQRPIPENDLVKAADMLERHRQALASGKEPIFDERSWIVPTNELKQRNYDLSSLNPHNGNGDSKPQSLETLIGDIDTKYQRVGEILADLRLWLAGKGIPE